MKSANPSLSVCEIGASIGRLWREMPEGDKQKYNDEFYHEKVPRIIVDLKFLDNVIPELEDA